MFKNNRHEVWEWDQELYDNSHATFSCMVRQDTVAVIPFIDTATILLLKEEQPDRDAPFWDVPGGCVEQHETDAMEAGARELHEETGYRATSLHLFRTMRFTGMTRFEEFIFLAKGLSDGEGPHRDPGERIALHPTPWKEAVARSLKGELRRQEVMLAILAMEFNPDARAMKETFLAS